MSKRRVSRISDLVSPRRLEIQSMLASQRFRTEVYDYEANTEYSVLNLYSSLLQLALRNSPPTTAQSPQR